MISYFCFLLLHIDQHQSSKNFETFHYLDVKVIQFNMCLQTETLPPHLSHALQAEPAALILHLALYISFSILILMWGDVFLVLINV